jgi:hypothetical protein
MTDETYLWQGLASLTRGLKIIASETPSARQHVRHTEAIMAAAGRDNDGHKIDSRPDWAGKVPPNAHHPNP